MIWMWLLPHTPWPYRLFWLLEVFSHSAGLPNKPNKRHGVLLRKARHSRNPYLASCRVSEFLILRRWYHVNCMFCFRGRTVSLSGAISYRWQLTNYVVLRSVLSNVSKPLLGVNGDISQNWSHLKPPPWKYCQCWPPRNNPLCPTNDDCPARRWSGLTQIL